MNKDKISSFLKQSGAYLSESISENIAQMINEEVHYARERQKKDDVRSAIQAFVSLGTPDAQILTLVSKFFSFDSVSDISSMIMNTKVNNQIRALFDHYSEKGMSYWEARNHIASRNVEEKLRNHTEMLTWPVEKLVKAIDNDKLPTTKNTKS